MGRLAEVVTRLALLLALLVLVQSTDAAAVVQERDGYGSGSGSGKKCRKTKVAILGAGVAGITAGQALSNQSIDDFLILEYNDEIGGRMKHTTFGKKKDGSPYIVELGANWVQGLGSKGGPENPIWTLAKKYKLKSTYSDYDSIKTYTDNGATDFSDEFDEFDTAYDKMSAYAGQVLVDNLQDTTVRTGFALNGWKPRRQKTLQKQMIANAIEWWEWDWETAWTPDESSLVFGITGYNATFNQWSDENNYVWDQRGFNYLLKREAATYLKDKDPRLLLNTIVKNITYSSSGVEIDTTDGKCVQAEYAICTFSLGVLQHDVVTFKPQLPLWKRQGIEGFQMGTYTKIFFQFNETFWDEKTQYFLYADPTTRGWYPVWQSLSGPGFLEGSNILFVTVVQEQSYMAERQSKEKTKEEALAVLRKMFPKIKIPEPEAFLYPRWSNVPWTFGSYSNWPPATTLEMHQNLRANVGRVFFAGEHTSASYFGFLHGAWYEGRDIGHRVGGLLGAKCKNRGPKGCGTLVNYPTLHGTTEHNEYTIANGWDVSPFLTYGL